ncbi:formin-like protein 3 [Stegodyphus dumicola]|uniref:formin-like protein 3 n=1 Tax=Stegodyphus dumicola TaxID=202533 RepID=UPI0015AC06F6|nr:formin-like protein 3 [Stegodyphus dumicola]
MGRFEPSDNNLHKEMSMKLIMLDEWEDQLEALIETENAETRRHVFQKVLKKVLGFKKDFDDFLMREADALLDAGKGPYHQEREPEEEDEVIAWPLNLLPPALWSEREASLFQPPSPPPITPPCPPKGNRKKRKRTESPVPMPQCVASSTFAPPPSPPCLPEGNRKKRKRAESPVPMPQGNRKKRKRVESLTPVPQHRPVTRSMTRACGTGMPFRNVASTVPPPPPPPSSSPLPAPSPPASPPPAPPCAPKESVSSSRRRRLPPRRKPPRRPWTRSMSKSQGPVTRSQAKRQGPGTRF